MKEKILFYRANEVPYGAFSNFDTKHPIYILGEEWPSTEHAFQAMKFMGTDSDYMEQIRSVPKPRDAAAMGRDRNHPLRSDWEQVKYDIMYLVVNTKFETYPELQKLLVSTGDAEIIEHTTNDNVWADGGDGSGKNWLGKILMDIRSKLQREIDIQNSCKHSESIYEKWEGEEILYICEQCGKILRSEENTK